MLIVGNSEKPFAVALKAALLLVFAALPATGAAQFSKLGRPEKIWAVFHPFAAMKVRSVSHQCAKIYDQPEIRQQTDGYASGGKLDAYRHVFYMAAFAQRVRVNAVRRLGRAHEKSNYLQFRKGGTEEGERPDSLMSEMDLRNNELGLAIGCNNRTLPLEELSTLAVTAIREGKAWIMKRNFDGQYTDCDGQILRTDPLRKKWSVPKCLVRSDHRGR